MQSWTLTGYFSNLTDSFVANCEFSWINGGLHPQITMELTHYSPWWSLVSDPHYRRVHSTHVKLVDATCYLKRVEVAPYKARSHTHVCI
jgi:hypothetical protein